MANFLYQLHEKEYEYIMDTEEPFSVIVNAMSRSEAKFASETETVPTFAQVRLLQNPAGGVNSYMLDFKRHDGDFFAFKNFYQKVY